MKVVPKGIESRFFTSIPTGGVFEFEGKYFLKLSTEIGHTNAVEIETGTPASIKYEAKVIFHIEAYLTLNYQGLPYDTWIEVLSSPPGSK